MAQSLADELAAFDEQAMGGGGMSLADEFGLEMEINPDAPSGLGTDLETELNGLLPASPALKAKGKASGLLSGAIPHGRASPSIDHTLDGLDENLRYPDGSREARSAKSSRSTMYGTASTRSGHDVTDVVALLEHGTDVKDALFGPAPMEPSPMSPRSPARTRSNGSTTRMSPTPPRERTSMISDTRQGGSPFLGHEAESDPLVELEEILYANRPFLDLVTRLNEPRGAGSQPPKSGNGIHASASSGTIWEGGIETQLQRHLDRMHEDDKLREEQCRELAVVNREIGSIRWESLEIAIELDLASGQESGLSVMDENEEEEEGEEAIGWTGEPRVRPAIAHQDRGKRAETPDLGDRLLGPPSPLTSSIPLSPLERSPSKVAEAGSLPRTLRLLVASTPDLLSSLQQLAETVHSSGSLTTSSMRQLRGIRAGVDSWRERENLEEDARRGIDEYERKKLEEGLRGEIRERTAAKLQRECLEFCQVLDGLEGRMEQVRRQGMFRRAIK